jgi:hypothetical protein
MDQLGDRSGLCLLHHAAAVELTVFADAEIARDLLVEPVLNDEPGTSCRGASVSNRTGCWRLPPDLAVPRDRVAARHG